MMSYLFTMVAAKVVILATYGATSNDKVDIMATLGFRSIARPFVDVPDPAL